MAGVIVLAWIAEILLFFVFWKLFHWIANSARSRLANGLAVTMAVNLAVAIILLVVVSNIHSPWWLMVIIGAATGVLTGQLVARGSAE